MEYTGRWKLTHPRYGQIMVTPVPEQAKGEDDTPSILPRALRKSIASVNEAYTVQIEDGPARLVESKGFTDSKYDLDFLRGKTEKNSDEAEAYLGFEYPLQGSPVPVYKSFPISVAFEPIDDKRYAAQMAHPPFLRSLLTAVGSFAIGVIIFFLLDHVDEILDGILSTFASSQPKEETESLLNRVLDKIPWLDFRDSQWFTWGLDHAAVAVPAIVAVFVFFKELLGPPLSARTWRRWENKWNK